MGMSLQKWIKFFLIQEIDLSRKKGKDKRLLFRIDKGKLMSPFPSLST